jgi:hypothetical protein
MHHLNIIIEQTEGTTNVIGINIAYHGMMKRLDKPHSVLTRDR